MSQHYDEAKTYVTATDYGVSYGQGGTEQPYEVTTLSVHLWAPDEPNRFGGHGVSHRHPEHDGLVFSTPAAAHQYALEHGLIKEFVR